MSITECNLYSKVKNFKTTQIGDLYFFENYLIAEFYEGVHISFDSFKEVKALIDQHFKGKKFGFIGNRVNSYSLVLSDAQLFNDSLKNLMAYATVTYTSIAEKVFDVENHFFDFNKKNFTCLFEATNWVRQTLESKAA
jgi:hypothetical protein